MAKGGDELMLEPYWFLGTLPTTGCDAAVRFQGNVPGNKEADDYEMETTFNSWGVRHHVRIKKTRRLLTWPVVLVYLFDLFCVLDNIIIIMKLWSPTMIETLTWILIFDLFDEVI